MRPSTALAVVLGLVVLVLGLLAPPPYETAAGALLVTVALVVTGHHEGAHR